MRALRAALAPALLWPLAGCIATQRDVLDLSQQTDEVKASVADLKRSIAAMQANQADLAVKMDQVRSDLSVFTENLKDSQERMTNLGSKLDDVAVALGQKVSALGESLTKQQQQQLVAEKAAQQAAEQAARDAASAAEVAAKKAAEQVRAQQAPPPRQPDAEPALPRRPGKPEPQALRPRRARLRDLSQALSERRDGRSLPLLSRRGALCG